VTEEEHLGLVDESQQLGSAFQNCLPPASVVPSGAMNSAAFASSSVRRWKYAVWAKPFAP
jgi:hypothetical protein